MFILKKLPAKFSKKAIQNSRIKSPRLALYKNAVKFESKVGGVAKLKI